MGMPNDPRDFVRDFVKSLLPYHVLYLSRTNPLPITIQFPDGVSVELDLVLTKEQQEQIPYEYKRKMLQMLQDENTRIRRTTNVD